MDFAPYQSSPPEHGRVASPEYGASPRASTDASKRPFSPINAARSPPPLQHPQPQRAWGGFDGQTSGWAGSAPTSNAPAGSSLPGAYPAAEVSEFDTSLGLRLDYEACLAYLAFPPIGAIVLLILERNSDYVRYDRRLIPCSFANKLDSTRGNLHYYLPPSWCFTSSFRGRNSSVGCSSWAISP